jgi:hypothetical protein
MFRVPVSVPFLLHSEILPRSRKLLYSYRAEFEEIHAHVDDEPEEVEEEDAPAPIPAPKKKRGQKRKATEDEDEAVPGVGSESLGELVKERAKKRNKKQRLADKRRKKEALFGNEPGESHQQQQQAEAEEDQPDADDDVDMHDADDDSELAELDLDVSSLEAVEEEAAITPVQQVSRKEQARLDAPLAKHKQQQHAKKKKGQKRIVPESVAEPEEEAQEELEVQPKKKQRTAPDAAPAPVVAPTPALAAVSASKPSVAKPTKTAVAAPASPTRAPLQPTTPPKHTKSASSALVGFGGTAVRVAPPSSSKKNVRIVLSNNQARQFKKFRRDSTITSALLTRLSPKSTVST